MNGNKLFVVISILVSLSLIGWAVLSSGKSAKNEENIPVNNVSIIDGKQIIEISAKNGYQPRASSASSDIPTVLRINTKGTLDCSSLVLIPSLKINKNLPISGVTDIDLGSPKTGTLQGMCGMGMFPFEIEFN